MKSNTRRWINTLTNLSYVVAGYIGWRITGDIPFWVLMMVTAFLSSSWHLFEKSSSPDRYGVFLIMAYLLSFMPGNVIGTILVCAVVFFTERYVYQETYKSFYVVGVVAFP